MSILQELLRLKEAGTVPVELRSVIASFPKHHQKALSQLWGGQRLVWHGMRFFDDGKLGEAYKKPRPPRTSTSTTGTTPPPSCGSTRRTSHRTKTPVMRTVSTPRSTTSS